MKPTKLQLWNAKIKYTRIVEEIIVSLSICEEPLPVFELTKHFSKKIHLATVYRVLEKLTQAGFVTKLQFNDQKSFYELIKKPHHHFICSSCSRVIDIQMEDELFESKKLVEKNYHIQINESSIQFNGICDKC